MIREIKKEESIDASWCTTSLRALYQEITTSASRLYLYVSVMSAFHCAISNVSFILFQLRGSNHVTSYPAFSHRGDAPVSSGILAFLDSFVSRNMEVCDLLEDRCYYESWTMVAIKLTNGVWRMRKNVI